MRTDPTLVVRVAGPPEAALDAIRRAVREVDVRVPVAHERTLRAVIDATLLLPRLRVALIAGFALIAFILAVIGVYATVAYSVTRRTLEFGIRAALGATRSTLLWTVVRGGMRPVLFGAAAGVLLGALLARTAAALLFRVSPLDPVAYLAAPLALLGVAAVAAAVPARRAAGVQPVAALRE